MVIIYEILLYIDGIIYGFIDGVYDIFDFLARINLFGEDKYNDIVGRIYIVLGVLMLFVLAYTLLRAIINPDEFSKGDSSFANLAKNIVVSLIIIVMLPTVFAVAFNIQDAILNTGTITKLVLGNMDEKYVEVYDDKEIEMTPGRMLAVNSFGSFFYPNPEFCEKELQMPVDDREAIEKCKDKIHSEVLIFFKSTKTLREVDASVKAGKISMRNYAKFGKAVKDDEITYSALISTAAGVFLLYVLLNFVFDMALRVIKLMFYQIIAPIPVICRIIPFGGFKDVFKNWLKQVTGVFFEVFVRIGIMNFGILLIKLTFEAFNDNYRHGVLALGRASYSLGWLQFTLARILIVMGIVMFIRKAPELLSKLFGIDTGGMKLGLREKLAQGGAFTAGAAIGAAGGMAIRNATQGAHNVRNRYQNARAAGQGRLRSALSAGGTAVRGLGSTIAGTVSAGTRGIYRGRNAQNRQDMRTARNGAIDTATRNRDERLEYRRTHQDTNQQHSAVRRWVHNNITGAPFGHIGDTYDDVIHWVNEGAEPHQAERRVYEQLNRYRGTVENNSNEILERSGNNNNLLVQVVRQNNRATYDAAIQQLRNTAAFQNANSVTQQNMINQTMNNLDQQLMNQAQHREAYGNAQNLDEIRRRVQRLQNTEYTQGMVVEGITYNGTAGHDQEAWDRYVANAAHALSDFERDANNVIRRSAMDSHDFITEHGDGNGHITLTQLNQARANIDALQGIRYTANMTHNGRTFRTQQEWTDYVTREQENLRNFDRMQELGWLSQQNNNGVVEFVYSGSSGIQDRIADINGATDSIQQTFNENGNTIRTNLDELLPQGQSLERMDSYERMDQFGHLTRRRNAQINVEREQRERRASARGGNNNGGNNGGGHH